MDVHRILEMFGKHLHIFAVSTLQFFLNRYGLSFTRIGVGMHCHLCMSPKQLLSPLVDPGWGGTWGTRPPYIPFLMPHIIF